MAKTSRIRNRGIIPERQHDAFLLALLIAVSINISFFAVQALLPKLAHLLQLLAPRAAALQQEQEEPQYPFVLVDSSLLDEELDPSQKTEAESTITRRARQTEATPDLPEGFAYREEGVDDYLTAAQGNPGMGEGAIQVPGDAQAPPSPDQIDSPEPTENIEETPPTEPSEPAEAAQSQQAAEPQEPVPPEEATPPESPQPEAPQPPPEPQPQPSEPPEPQPEAPEPPTEVPPPAEPPPETPEERPDIPEPPQDFPEPETVEREQPSSELIDLASLPVSPEGFFVQERRPEERFRRRPNEAPTPEQFEQPRERVEAARPQVQPITPAQFGQQSESRPNRPNPTFKRIGGGSTAGGAPPRRNTSTSVKLLDSDANMAYLAHRYGEYMAKVARQLQDSLNRQIVLSPSGYTAGQVKIRFGITPDGQINFYETQFPTDGTLSAERIMSERMLREAGPFDPFTQDMMKDIEFFQRLTVLVNLYM